MVGHVGIQAERADMVVLVAQPLAMQLQLQLAGLQFALVAGLGIQPATGLGQPVIGLWRAEFETQLVAAPGLALEPDPALARGQIQLTRE